MAMDHSDAGMATLVADGGYLISGHQPLNLTCEGHLAAGQIIKVYEPDATLGQGSGSEPAERALKCFVTPCPEEECDAARAQLEPYMPRSTSPNSRTKPGSRSPSISKPFRSTTSGWIWSSRPTAAPMT